MSVFALYVLCVYVFIQCSCEDAYTNKYDGVDLDEILTNDRLLTGYVKCLLDSGPCSPDAKELKKNLPDAIENDCKKCTRRQQEGADQVMHYIIDHRPDDWVKLEKKYNADGSYKKKYLENKKKEEESSSASEESKENDEKSEENKHD